MAPAPKGRHVSDTDGTVHRPDEATAADQRADAADRPAGRSEPEPAGFGTRGWFLVAVVVLSVLVVPGAVYLFPALPADAGLPFVAAMLVLPMLPAVLLGLTAVWSMTAAAGDREKD
jgi:hypothetical protein